MSRWSLVSGRSPVPRGVLTLLAVGLVGSFLASSALRAQEFDAGAGEPLVLVSRYLRSSRSISTRTEAIERALSGRLIVLETDGSVRTLVDASLPDARPDLPTDVADPSISYDGERVVFAGYHPGEAAWRIWEIGVDGSGLRQVTRSDQQTDVARFGEHAARFESYDDVDPCYLPDGRIVFVSTRYPQVAPDSRVRATNLHVVDASGENVHRITSERFGADTPAIDPTSGKIVYSRWWRSPHFRLDAPTPGQPESQPEVPPGSPGYGGAVPPPPVSVPVPALRELPESDFPGLNSWFLADLRPDGTDMVMRSGRGLDRELTQAWKPSFLASGETLALFIPRTPWLGRPRGDGLRIVPRGEAAPVFVSGPQSFPVASVGQLENFEFVYASAEALDDGSLIVSASRPGSEDYDIWRLGEDGLRLIYGLSGTSETDAVPVRARALPPVLEDRDLPRLADVPPRTVEEAFDAGGRFTFVVENIFGNAPVDSAIATAPPFGPELFIEFYTNPQRTGVFAPDRPLLVHRLPVPASGRIEVELPAGVPLFEVLKTADDQLPLGRDGQIFHVGGHNFGVAGEGARCVGCHAGHSMMEVPADPSYTNLAPSAAVSGVGLETVVGAERIQMRAEKVVDRSTAPFSGEWVAAQGLGRLELRWEQSISAREVIIYGPRPRDGRTPVLRGGRLDLLEGTRTVASVELPSPISPEGSRVEVPPTAFRLLRITVPASGFEGEAVDGVRSPAIAEIEVIARAASTVRFLRADADCDGTVRLTDAVTVLNGLFAGGEICCAEAADVDGSADVDLSDAVSLLNHLFAGGPAPAAPYPSCGAATASGLSCSPRACN